MSFRHRQLRCLLDVVFGAHDQGDADDECRCGEHGGSHAPSDDAAFVGRFFVPSEKEKRIREAEGQAEAIIKIQQANADGIRMIKEAGADQTVLQLKSLEAFAKAADGKATKIIIPSEIQSLAGLVTSVTESAKKSETEN